MKRLPLIFSFITECDVFADIGCDHGFISQFVLKNRLAKTVITADISEKCLNKAKILLADFDNVRFLCTDGLNGIDADLVVIAGLGGGTIIEILQKKLQKLGRLDGRFILQPQDKCGDVRRWLVENGYKIMRDCVAKENGKFYDVMLFSKGYQRLDGFQTELGAFYDSTDLGMSESRNLLIERLKKEYKKFCGYNDGGKNEEKRAFLKQSLLRLSGEDAID